MTDVGLEEALAHIASVLRGRGRAHCLVGGLAVSVRGEVRFTRDVDLAVLARNDDDAESLVRELVADGYRTVAIVEHEEVARLSTARLVGPAGVKVDLLFASCGVEDQIIQRASKVTLPRVGDIAVAAPEDLLAMKTLSMSDRRLQDRIDARSLLRVNSDLDVDAVRQVLGSITDRGYHRDQDLSAKLDGLLRDIES